MKDIKELIRFQLIKMTKRSITVAKDGKTFTLYLNEYEGEYCSYTEIENTLYIDENDKPVITNIEYDKDDCELCATAKITFFGLDKTIATIEAEAGSESGYGYGAYVTLECDTLDFFETLAEW